MSSDTSHAIMLKALEDIAKGDLSRSKQVQLAKDTLAKIGVGKPSHMQGLTAAEIAARAASRTIQRQQVRR